MTAFNLTTPCDNCPFRREGGIRLHRKRAHDIAALFTDEQGGTFPCHKTVDYDTDTDDDGPRPMRPEEKMCAGGLIFAEKQGVANQMVRIMERIGAYDPRKLRGHDAVFDDLDEMLAAQEPPRKKRRTA
jgi:hypothetical protein